nr:patatin-like phospholipase family protein [Prolixibacteraceae bacterium]
MNKNLLILIFLFLAVSARPQSVGLVLSGGGAKGLAHIGVIKELEEHNIPIDYIAGTSIGAIIGGLYASGYTPDEMIELFSSDEFRLWSTGKMDKEDLFYFKQRNETPGWIKVDITRKEDKLKVIFPINLIPERQIDFAFLEITAQTTAACEGDFDRLMIPFRCVSTDIYNNKAIIHRTGDVGEAIRASMTFPFVYKPIEKDGMLLYDGGIVNNFPTDIMEQDFHPDIIIGHKVSRIGERYDSEDLFNQIESIVTQKTDYSIPDSLGVLLETRLDDVSLLDFPKVHYTVQRGKETAQALIERIEKRVQRRITPEEVQKKRDLFNGKKPPLQFNNLQVEGIRDNQQRKFIIQSFKTNESILGVDALRDSYFKLISDEQIKSIRPIARYNKRTGFFDVHLKVTPRKPLDVEVGGHLSTQASTFGFIGVNYKTFKTLAYHLSGNAYFGKFYNSVSIGGRMDSPSARPFYLDFRYTFNAWDFTATNNDLMYADINPSYIQQNENNLHLEGGFPFVRTGVVDFGVAYSQASDHYYQSTLFAQGDIMDKTTFQAFTAHARIDQKNFDYKQYPTDGGRKMLCFRYIYGNELFTPGSIAPVNQSFTQDHSYFQIRALYDQYYPINKFLTLGMMAEAAFNNKELCSNYTSTLLSAPAFTPTPGSQSRYLEYFRANQYFALGGKALLILSDYLHFRSEFYAFAPVQGFQRLENNGIKYNESLFPEVRFTGMAALVFQTQAGPISAEINYFDKQGQKWFFSVNLGFLLFNQ